ncbi:MAG TPA: hypothetical protein VM692_08885, partial [Gammaproteobacteria bacterium]|nr:hypothetical protein [Gammaproteobacteria bacterium]
MLELEGTSPRSFAAATVAALLFLVMVAAVTYRVLGLEAASALAAAGGVALILGLLFAASKRLRRADDGLRLGERALEAVPHALFVVDALQPGRPNRYVNPA